jgi:hypothetical protein
LVSDAEEFYNHQRSIGTVWGVVLPSWDQLSLEQKFEWEARLNEQINRDKEADDFRRSE